MMRPLNQQQLQQQVIPVQQEQPRYANNVNATTAAVIDAPPPSVHMSSRQTLAQPVVRTTVDAIIDVAPVVLPPPPPAPPSLPARVESLPMPLPSPLPALDVHGPPPQVRIPSRRMIAPTSSVPVSSTLPVAALPPTALMLTQAPTTHLPVDVAIDTGGIFLSRPNF